VPRPERSAASEPPRELNDDISDPIAKKAGAALSRHDCTSNPRKEKTMTNQATDPKSKEEMTDKKLNPWDVDPVEYMRHWDRRGDPWGSITRLVDLIYRVMAEIDEQVSTEDLFKAVKESSRGIICLDEDAARAYRLVHQTIWDPRLSEATVKYWKSRWHEEQERRWREEHPKKHPEKHPDRDLGDDIPF
jgi:hypothetical protein